MTLAPAATSMLGSVVALTLLHLVMMLALYATRLPAMVMMKMSARATGKPGALDTLPKWARNPAANYNNLAEAPTAFYAIVIAVVVLGQADLLFAVAAWAYVALRYAHSAVQATVNIVMVRFSIFSLSWLVLGIMIVRSAALLIVNA